MSTSATAERHTSGITALVSGCRSGDQESWRGLVERFSPLVWAVARSHRLSPADCEEVYQRTWLRVVQHLDTLRDSQRFPDWITTAARRESLKHRAQVVRYLPVGDDIRLRERPDPADGPEETVIRGDRRARLLRAFRQLSARDQQILGVFLVDPPPSYDEASRLLGIPRGSVGPTRGRALRRLADLLAGPVADGVEPDDSW